MRNKPIEEKEIDFPQLFGLKRYSSQYSDLRNGYIFSHITNLSPLPAFTRTPLRIPGIAVLLCRRGKIELDVNLTHYTLSDNSLMSLRRGSIVDIKSQDSDDIDAYIFVISPDFSREINFDINVVQTAHYHAGSMSPLMSLAEKEVDTLCRYLDIIHYNTVDNPDAIYVKAIARNVIAAFFYQTMQFVSSRFKESDQTETTPPSRRTTYVKEFLRLIHEHHCTERSVAFYASKLFISPKYLSLLLKESTGRSAVEWIDEYVLLEAKNMLRFSGKNIQQIAYELNFSNQSAFGKYFKNLTGMSPSEFQRS